MRSLIVNRVSSFLQRAAFVLTVYFLAGCGGGSGSDGDRSIASGVVYAGSTEPATIDMTNLAVLVSGVIGTSDSTGVIAGKPKSVTAKGGFLALGRGIERHLREARIKSFPQQSEKPMPLATVGVDETQACESGAIRFTGTVNDDGTGLVAADYMDCRFGGETLNGTVEMRVDASDFNYFDVTFSFSILTITTSTSSESLGGVIRLQAVLSTNTETLTFNLVARDDISGHMSKVDDFVVATVFDDLLFPTSLTQTLNGRVYDSVHGYVDVTTIDPMGFSGLAQIFPDSGQLVLSGAANTSIRLTAVSVSQVRLELDADGDGGYEVQAIRLWTDIDSTTEADFVPAEDAPVLEGGSDAVVPPDNGEFGASDFIGTWVNDTPNGGMTRIIIGQVGPDLTIQGFGSCVPMECDWGTISTPYTGNPFVAVYEHGFKTNSLTIGLIAMDALHVHSDNVFHDGTNRDYSADYFFHKE